MFYAKFDASSFIKPDDMHPVEYLEFETMKDAALYMSDHGFEKDELLSRTITGIQVFWNTDYSCKATLFEIE